MFSDELVKSTGSSSPSVVKYKSQARAFTLIELLLVITIIASLGTMVGLAFNQISAGWVVTQAGYQLNDQLAMARQKAVARNVSLELRFIEESDEEAMGSPKAYNAIQLWQVDPRGGESKAIGSMEKLPPAVVINPGLSSLLTATPAQSFNFPGLGTRSYTGLRFRPNGRLQARSSLAGSCLTVQLKTADLVEPTNYFTLQINPLTGRIASYRP